MKLRLLLTTSIAAGMLVVGAAQAAPPSQPMQGVKSAATSKPVELPSDSVYQLPLKLTDQKGRNFDWTTRRGKPQLVAMFRSEEQTSELQSLMRISYAVFCLKKKNDNTLLKL